MKKIKFLIFIFSFSYTDKKKLEKKSLVETFKNWKKQKKLTTNYSITEQTIQNKKKDLSLGKLEKEEYLNTIMRILKESKLTEQEKIKLGLKYYQE